MWSGNVAFDNTFITKKRLKLNLNLKWFKLYTISLKKRQFILADTYNPWKDTFKPSFWKAIWDRVQIWKNLLWIFHLVDLFFVIGFKNNTISFSFSCFIKMMAKKQGIHIFSTGHPQCHIIIAILWSLLVLVLGFNNNSINTVSFSIYLPFYVIFIKKWQKTRDCNFQHRPPIMEGCWRTSASSCCKSWRGSCGHRS